MAFPPSRIQAAARAIMSDWGCIDAPTEREVQYALERAEEVLKAAYPDLASGEAWVVPTHATEAMAFSTGTVTPSEANTVWNAMRDAHLRLDLNDKEKP
jgi:hypothetical protein